MVKLLVFVKRRSDISLEAFAKHWIEVHGPLVRNFPGVREVIRKYSQCLTIDGLPSFVEPAPFDGVAEFWFDNIDGMNAAFASESYRTFGFEDEARIMDRSQTKMLLTVEYEVE